VGIVLRNFGEVVAGVEKMLQPGALEQFRKNVSAQNNQAVFEIPRILSKLLKETGEGATMESENVNMPQVHFRST